jgi:hypothetical protein
MKKALRQMDYIVTLTDIRRIVANSGSDEVVQSRAATCVGGDLGLRASGTWTRYSSVAILASSSSRSGS